MTGVRQALCWTWVLAVGCGPAGGPQGRLAPELDEGQPLASIRGDAGTVDAGAECPPPTLPDLRQRVFVPRCALAGCHLGPDAPEGLTFDDPDLASRLARPSRQSPSGMPLVTPGQTGASYLYLKVVLETPLFGGPMPPPARLPDCQIAAIRQWIEAGAP